MKSWFPESEWYQNPQVPKDHPNVNSIRDFSTCDHSAPYLQSNIKVNDNISKMVFFVSTIS